MKRFSILVLVLALVIVCIPISANASSNSTVMYGNIDYKNDYEVDVSDVTLIQRFLIQAIAFDEIQMESADYDHNGDVTLLDATYIQRSLSSICVPDGFGGKFHLKPSVSLLYANYESGKAMVGVPVTFTVDESKQNDLPIYPIEYRFVIYSCSDKSNPIAVRDFSQERNFTYTFESAEDTYEINVYLRNRFGYEGQVKINSYHVIRPYSLEKPIITSVYTDQYGNRELYYSTSFRSSLFYDNMVFFAIANGGSGDYQYSFEYKMKDKSLIQDYSYNNSFVVEKLNYPGWEENGYPENDGWAIHSKDYKWYEVEPFELIVKVKDSDGNISSESYLISAIDDFGLIG